MSTDPAVIKEEDINMEFDGDDNIEEANEA